jgi:hypothetical protein
MSLSTSMRVVIQCGTDIRIPYPESYPVPEVGDQVCVGKVCYMVRARTFLLDRDELLLECEPE